MSTWRTTSEASSGGGMSTDLRIGVDSVPEPGLLRPAIEAALSGRAWPDGPEATIADAVASRVVETYRQEAGRW